MADELNKDGEGLDWYDDEYKREIKEAKKRIFAAAHEEFNKVKEGAKRRAIIRAKIRLEKVMNANDQSLPAGNATNDLASSGMPEINPTYNNTEIQNQVNSHLESTMPAAITEEPAVQKSSKFALIVYGLDNIILDNYDRKMQTYLEFGWDRDSIDNFISKKENKYGKIASFNTNRVTFTASSRRNRYYEVYNRPDMLEYDKPFHHCLKAINALSINFDIYIVSERTEDLEEKTLEVMEKLGFPMDKVKVYFKKVHTILRQYKKNCIVDIKSRHDAGVGLIIHPKDASVFNRYDFAPIGFASIKNQKDFDGKTEVVCKSWMDIIRALAEQ
ncbi:MAG: hypothetical protein GF364_20420 [Candidatus Lokiarchaeota archaeon]|nr:hypothetical protein [Candidatus Lokiarchaeota archaeon]